MCAPSNPRLDSTPSATLRAEVPFCIGMLEFSLLIVAIDLNRTLPWPNLEVQGKLEPVR
jgi:hypothetical protein